MTVIDLSTIGGTTIPKALAASLVLALAERTTLGIFSSPAFRYQGMINGSNSGTIKSPVVDLDGFDLPASDTEVGALGFTDIGNTSVDVVPAFKRLHRRVTDYVRIVDGYGMVDYSRLALDFIIGKEQGFIADALALSSTFTSSVGTTNTALTLAAFQLAQETLDVANSEGGIAILHSRQWADLKTELSFIASGATGYLPATQEAIQRLGRGFKGTLFGTLIFVHNRVPTANTSTDRLGMMLGPDAIQWADAQLPIIRPEVQASVGADRIGLDTDEIRGDSTISYTTMYGLSRLLDGAGCKILSRNS